MDQNEVKKIVANAVKELSQNEGDESGHMQADELLLRVIEELTGSDEITKAFGKIPNMWYA